MLVLFQDYKGKAMKLFSGIFRWLARRLEEEREAIYQQEEQQTIEQESTTTLEVEDKQIIEESQKEVQPPPANIKNRKKKPGTLLLDPRDMMEIMEYPYLSLSKNRTAPIYYERKISNGIVKIKVSCHPPHYVASIYDWDIILFVESKIQEIINYNSDIPPRTLIIPRHEILKALRKHGGNKQNKDLHASLTRLKTTVIETSVRNEDRKYDCFGWLDSWGYTERKDIKEIRITLSQWLYDGICKKGALLKVSQEYFDLTSGLKKFLYRTARKHTGNNNQWEFSIEKLYEKSGSEQEFKKFKYDLKKAVLENDIPEYILEWKEDQGVAVVRFINKNKKSIQTDKIINSKTIGKRVNNVVSSLRMPRQITK